MVPAIVTPTYRFCSVALPQSYLRSRARCDFQVFLRLKVPPQMMESGLPWPSQASQFKRVLNGGVVVVRRARGPFRFLDR